MKKVIVSAVVVVSALASASAHAWGPREQGIVAGAAGLWIFQQLNKAGQPQQVIVQQPPVVYQQPPVVYQAPVPQQYCESRIMTDQFGQQREFTSCYYR